ncbi:MAG: CAP domain-containing protein [Microthrixaceae bacterium]
MPRTPPPPSRNRRRLLPLIAAALLLVLVGVGCESTRQDHDLVLQLVNQSRAQAGLPTLRSNVMLDVKADRWAQRLRDSCSLSHSRLADGAPSNWRKLGENVGDGGDIAQVHQAYLNAPGHRANIMDPLYTSMGAAAVWGDCDGQHRVFTVQVFMKN